MTNEEKQLLLIDLCARLPYGIFVEENHESLDDSPIIYTDDSPIIYTFDYHPCIDNCKPYLRKLSSMTEEEQFQLGKLLGATSYNLLKGEYSSLKELLEYVYKNHIDLFGLIPMGLALEAKEGMYNN